MMTVLRSVVSWLLAVAFIAVGILVAVVLAFGNFVIAWQSFAAQGFEQTPLSNTPFLGLFAEAVGLGEVPVAALYALVLTVGMNWVVISAAKKFARMVQLFFDYRDLRASAHPSARDQARQCRERLLETAMWLAPAIVATALIVRFDVKQFVFRYETLAHDVPDLGATLGWAADALERVGQFLAPFISAAAWGYVGLVVGVALSVEYAFVRATERWQRLDLAIQRAIEGETADRHVSGSRSVPQPRVAVTEEAVPNGVTEPKPNETLIDAGARASAERVPEPVPGPRPPTDPPTVTAASEVPHVDVIVGPGERRRVAVSELEARPDEFVRDGAGRAWFLRSYYEQAVLGSDGRKEKTA